LAPSCNVIASGADVVSLGGGVGSFLIILAEGDCASVVSAMLWLWLGGKLL
jgi:hypothetical protein